MRISLVIAFNMFIILHFYNTVETRGWLTSTYKLVCGNFLQTDPVECLHAWKNTKNTTKYSMTNYDSTFLTLLKFLFELFHH